MTCKGCRIERFMENMGLPRKIRIGRIPGAEISKTVFADLGIWEDLTPHALQTGKSRQVCNYYDQIFQMKISSHGIRVQLSLEGSRGRIFEVERVLENI